MEIEELYRVDGSTAVITGAGSGIGRACAIQLAEAGASMLFLTGRRKELLDETALMISSLAPKTKVMIADGDINSPVWRRELISEVFVQGPLDILINNAGIYHSSTFEDTTDEELTEVIQTNLTSVFSLTRDLLPLLERSTYPSIINIGSTLSFRPIAQGAGYNMTKAALDHLTRSLALELGPRRIRVNCVSPGIIETPMYRGRFSSDKAYRDAIDQATLWHPLGRVGSPEDVARSVLFLASRASSWITGVVLPVDGGLLTA
jgi:NAD(P)-dependent dehydrogenase (short-subunit alcohol dehydrogenase family)